jgi:hypothetical protein
MDEFIGYDGCGRHSLDHIGFRGLKASDLAQPKREKSFQIIGNEITDR